MVVHERVAIATAAVCLALFGAVCACTTRQQWGFPRVAVEATSPDGRYVALVKNQPSIDPPAQTITVGRVEGTPIFVQKLSEDQDWCHVVVWSAQSNRVAFLVQDARLIVVDPGTGTVATDRWLVPEVGSYPPTHTVEGLSLSPDGTSARFRACRRATGVCSDWQTAPLG